MSKLLSDEELSAKFDAFVKGGYHACYCPQLDCECAIKDEYVKEMLDLINTQKRLFAESVISGDDTVQNEGDTETFKHMLTVLMIMFGDAREYYDDRERSEKLTGEAFEYAESWLEVFRAEQRARIK